MIKKIGSNIKKHWRKVFPMALSLGITLFIFINSYELAFNKDLPYFEALEPVNLDVIEQSYEISPYLDTKTFNDREFGVPISLRISGGKARSQLASSIFENGTWLARLNAGHVTTFTIPGDESENDNLLIYMNSGVRTIEDINEVMPTDHVFVDTIDGWRYIFRVSDIQSLAFDRPYVVEKVRSPKLVIVIQDSATKTNQVISAHYITTDQL